MPFDNSAGVCDLGEHPPRRSHVNRIAGALAPDDPGALRPSAGRFIQGWLRFPDKLADHIRDYWRREGYDVDVRVERIRDTRDFSITSNLINGRPA
jgi:hypothetical protein